MRTLAAVLASIALILASVTALCYLAQPDPPAPIIMQPADPRPTLSVDMRAQILETCAWEQATFYAPVRSREQAYQDGMSNCVRSADKYGWDQLIQKYAATK